MADLNINLNSETRRIVDILAGAAIGVALSVGLYENPVKIADQVSAAMDPPPFLSVQVNDETPKVRDFIFGATRFVASQNALSAGMYETSTLKLSDQLTVSLGLLAPVTEPVKVGASGTVDLIGLGNPVRITDGPVSASLQTGSGDLSPALLTESLKVVEATLLETLDPEQVSASEAVKVSDTVTPLLVQGVILQETVLVVDTPQLTLNPERATPSESLGVADTPLVSITPIFSALTEALKVVDSGEAELIRTEEGFLVSDAVTAVITPELASALEALSVVDQTPIATLVSAGSLTASVSESLKITDSPSVTLNPEETSTISEALKVVDQPTLTIDPELATSSESLKIADSLAIEINPEQATPAESLKVTDQAALTIDPEQASPSESLKVADQAAITIDPEQASPSEAVKIADQTPSAVLVQAGTLIASPDEQLKVADQPALTINPELTSAVEPVKVFDIAFAALAVSDLSATPSEAVKVADNATAALQLSADLSEGLSVADGTPTGRLNPLQLLLTEPVKVADLDPSVASGTTIVANPTEALKVVDTATVALDPEERALAEAVKVTDTVVTVLTPEVVTAQETLVITDTVQASLGTLLVSLSEAVNVSESLLLGGPPIIDVVGSYSTVIDVVGERL